MRGFTPDERWALAVLAGPPSHFDAKTPEGARLDDAMSLLIERGCVVYRRWLDDSATSFGLTEIGRVAARISVLADLAFLNS